MVTNIVLITSIINTPPTPLSYINTRSIYTREERFEQTKKTIQSIKEKIPDKKIFIVECSDLTEVEKTYFIENTDIFLNLFNEEKENYKILQNIHSVSKSLGEGTMTIEAIKYLNNNNIKYDNFYKISGRYWLNENFDYKLFNNNNKIIFKKIDNYACLTCLYKLPFELTKLWYDYLLNSNNEFYNCTGYEVIFCNFINSIKKNNEDVHQLGILGNISVSGDFIDF